MMWKEITIRFLISGFVFVLVPNSWWQSLFLTQGNGALHLIENAFVAPLIAVASFVCSVGNIPLASLLWSGGISFGGMISFIYADLIVLPLILIYKKYYGMKMAAYITAVIFVSMVTAGIAVDLLFAALNLIPTNFNSQNAMTHASFVWNYTTYLGITAILIFALMVWIRLRKKTSVAESHETHEHGCAH